MLHRGGEPVFTDKQEMFFHIVWKRFCGNQQIIVLFHWHGPVCKFTFAEETFLPVSGKREEIDIILRPDGWIISPPFSDLGRNKGQLLRLSLSDQELPADILKRGSHEVRYIIHHFIGGVCGSQQLVIAFIGKQIPVPETVKMIRYGVNCFFLQPVRRMECTFRPDGLSAGSSDICCICFYLREWRPRFL